MSGKDERDTLDAASASDNAGQALIKALDLVKRSLGLDLRVSAPATVVSYDAATQRADVTVGFVRVAYAAGVPVQQPPDIVARVPVEWVGGSLGYVTTPLVAGDTGMLAFTDRALALWLDGPGTPVDPGNARVHDLADAVFRPGLRPDPRVIAPPTALDGTVVEGPLVKLGRLATHFAVRGTALATSAGELAAILGPVPAAADPASTAVLANANKAALMALFAAIAESLSTKVQVQ